MKATERTHELLDEIERLRTLLRLAVPDPSLLTGLPEQVVNDIRDVVRNQPLLRIVQTVTNIRSKFSEGDHCRYNYPAVLVGKDWKSRKHFPAMFVIGKGAKIVSVTFEESDDIGEVIGTHRLVEIAFDMPKEEE